MKKQIFIVPFLFFILILLAFFYLLMTERNPSELPSNLLNKNVPKFEANSLIKKEKFVSSEEFGNEIDLLLDAGILQNNNPSKIYVFEDDVISQIR